MITKLEPGVESELLDFIGDDYRDCLYLYANLAKYGLENPNMSMWRMEINKSLVAIAQRYYSCMHIFCKNSDWDVDEIIDLIKLEKPRVILATQDVTATLYKILYEDYHMHTMNLFYFPINTDFFSEKYSNLYNDQIEEAKMDDIDEITDFLMEDKTNKEVYERNTLYNQLRERFIDGYSRYFVIKVNGKIIATTSTKAEHPRFAVRGGLIVHENYRGKNIGKFITYALIKLLQQEGKASYSFISDENIKSLRMIEGIGYKLLGKTGKLIANVSSGEE
jgi:GNAT superfamily N-acetyltransferase